MSDLIQLDYATRRRWSAAAVAALAIGVCSGPIAVLLVWLENPGYGVLPVGGAIAAILGGLCAAYSGFVYASLARQARIRGRLLALIGLLAALIWPVVLIALFGYISSQLE